MDLHTAITLLCDHHRFWEKKKNRIWQRKVKYDVRKVRATHHSCTLPPPSKGVLYCQSKPDYVANKGRVFWLHMVVPQNFADSRVRVKGRFVKKEDEAILMELNTLTTKEVRISINMIRPFLSSYLCSCKRTGHMCRKG